MNSSKGNKNTKKRLLGISSVVLVLIATVILLERANVTHLFHDAAPKALPVTASPDTKGEPSTSQTASNSDKSSQNSSTPTTSSQPGDQKSSSSGSTGGTLLSPAGDFVSAHKNVPSSASLSSVCNTTAGATCKISFTSTNGTVKSLDSQTTDRGGSTYWNSWSPKAIGLTTGSWTVQAIASLNGQTKTSSDALPLEVSE